MVWFSYHGGHSGEFCRHAKGTLRQVVERAVESGFTIYGLSEHCPRVRQRDLFQDEAAMTPTDLQSDFSAYIKEARALQNEFADRIELLVGFETETLPESSWLETMRGVQAQHDFDFFIGSVHSVRDTYVDYKAEITAALALECGGWDALCIAYFEQVAELVGALTPPVVGHFDLVRRFRGNDVIFDGSVWPSIERALEAVKASGALLELNSAPCRRQLGPVYPSPQILSRARAMDIPLTLSDDSHGAHDVGGGLESCVQAASEAGYEQLHYLTRSPKPGAVPTSFNAQISQRAVAIEEVSPRARP